MPNESRFPIGAAVRLKSGGSVMIVKEVSLFLGKFGYRCLWVDTFGGILHGEYNADELELVATDKPSGDDVSTSSL